MGEDEQAELLSVADGIKTVRNDVYTTKRWQLALNFVLGASGVALLVVTMFAKGTANAVCAVTGVAFMIALVVFNMALRAVRPTSFLQYVYKDVKKGVTYYFQILSKTRYAFSDGKNHIEVERGEAYELEERSYGIYSYDFFTRMTVDDVTEKNGVKTYRGSMEYGGKPVKCAFVIKNGTPLYGSIAGTRIKYFDINDTKNKFVVPDMLKRAVNKAGVHFPKAPGLYVRDDLADVTKQ